MFLWKPQIRCVYLVLLSGTYNITVTDAINCLGVFEVQITAPPAVTTSESSVICYGDSVEINGGYIKDSGIYIDSLVTQEGCDSIVIISVDVRNLGLNNDSIYGPIKIDTTQAYAYFIPFDVSIVTYNWITNCGNILLGNGTNTVNVQWENVTTCELTLVINDGSCYDTLRLTVSQEDPLGITSTVTGFDIKLYPNPTTGVTTLSWTSLKNLKPEIDITDALGRRVMMPILRVDMNSYIIDTRGVESGVYMVEFRTEDIIMIKRLVKTE